MPRRNAFSRPIFLGHLLVFPTTNVVKAEMRRRLSALRQNSQGRFNLWDTFDRGELCLASTGCSETKSPALALPQGVAGHYVAYGRAWLCNTGGRVGKGAAFDRLWHVA
jgi:hypothetical protein